MVPRGQTCGPGTQEYGPEPTVVPAVTAADSFSRSDNPAIESTSSFRYTTVNALCIDMTGLLTLELCEADRAEGVGSLHSVSLSLQACALLSEVARCFTNEVFE